MPKKEKQKKSTDATVAPPSLPEDQRFVEVQLLSDIKTEVSLQNVVVVLRLHNEEHRVVLSDAARKVPPTLPSVESSVPGQLPGSGGSRHSVLARQVLRVGDKAALRALLNRKDANRVEVYATPDPATSSGPTANNNSNEDASNGVGLRKASKLAEKKPKANTPMAKAKTKAKAEAAAGRVNTGPPDNARRIGCLSFSLISLVASTSLDITVPLCGGASITPALPIHELRLRICCHEAPLLTPQDVLRCRPVALCIGGIDGIPPMPDVAAAAAATAPLTATTTPLSTDVSAAVGALSSSSSPVLHHRLRARVKLADAHVSTPSLCPMPLAASSPLPSQYDHLLFLNELGTTLEVYRQLYATSCTVSLWQSFDPVGGAAVDMDEREDPSTPTSNRSEALLGRGAFSVRDFLTDNQLRFSETVQLLPDRSTVSLAGGQTCLSAASSITVTLNFFAPFPPLQHVDANGTLLKEKAFLTHALLRMPYAAPWMVDCVALLMREITACPRVTEDVHVYAPPPPTPPSEDPEAAPEKPSGNAKATAGNDGGGNAASASGAAAMSTKRSNKKEGGASDEGKSKKEGGRAGRDGDRSGGAAASASVAGSPFSDQQLPPEQRFDAPIQVCSPPGISGFEVADGEERLWCLEGTVPELHRLLTQLSAFVEAHEDPAAASPAVDMLFNTELFVPQRAFVSFPPLVTPPVSFVATTAASTVASTAAPPPVSARNSAVAKAAATTAETPCSTTTTVAGGGGAFALEVEPSGTGGRVHRMRLRCPLEELRQTQSCYVRHALSDDCLHCLQCLTALRTVPSMREAELRGWIPSASHLITVERSFGRTLEKPDLFGATPPPASSSFSSIKEMKESVRGAAGKRTTARSSTWTPAFTRAYAAASLVDGLEAGTFVSFEGSPHTGKKPRSVPPAVRQRFSTTAWMTVSDTGENILCAFSHNAPNGLVHYHIEGQIVHFAGVALLYVLKCECLARSFTQSHNVAYEEVLRERQRAQHTRRTKPTNLWPAAAAALDGTSGVSRQKIETVAVAAGRSQQQQQRKVGFLRSDDDDDLENSEGNWLASDFYDHVDGAASALSLASSSRRAPVTIGAATRGRQAERFQLQVTPGGIARAATAPQKPEMAHEQLWRLYEQRAPVNGPAAHTEKLPPIRHK